MPPKFHPEFDVPGLYEYPQHLRQTLADLPPAPGVYTFHGEEGDLPLYIGKSVNLRQRVLSHLRTEDEARMLRMTRRITYVRTAGDIGALLLEAQCIKQQQPLFNQKLRRNRQLCAWQLPNAGTGLTLVHAATVNFATEPRLFGLFGSRHAAIQALQALADEHRLCHSVLGLEKVMSGKACFRFQIRRCAGACCGQETHAAHQQRLVLALQAMQVVCWPYAGAVALQETCPLDAAFTQFHVVRNWCYLGSATTLDQARQLDRVAAGFDADGYKILCKPLLQDATTVIAL